MKKVEKCVNEMMEWMNNVMNAQARKSLDQEPVVRAQEIKAKIKVSVTDCSVMCFLRDSSCNHLNDHFSYKSFTSSWLRPDFLVYYWYHKIQKTCVLAVHQMVFNADGRNSVRGVRKFWIMERTQVGLWSGEALGGVGLEGSWEENQGTALCLEGAETQWRFQRRGLWQVPALCSLVLLILRLSYLTFEPFSSSVGGDHNSYLLIVVRGLNEVICT